MERVIRSASSPRLRTPLMFKGKGRTKKQFMKDCDINLIVQRGEKNGVLDHITRTPPTYGDATGIDFQESMNTIILANEMFSALPSHVRRKFGNDPAEYLEFCDNPDNAEEMRLLGIMKAKPEAPEGSSTGSEAESSGSQTNTEESTSEEQA